MFFCIIKQFILTVYTMKRSYSFVNCMFSFRIFHRCINWLAGKLEKNPNCLYELPKSQLLSQMERRHGPVQVDAGPVITQAFIPYHLVELFSPGNAFSRSIAPAQLFACSQTSSLKRAHLVNNTCIMCNYCLLLFGLCLLLVS